MARVAILNERQTFTETIEDALRQAGHQVISEVAPIDLERLVGFAPQVLLVGLALTEPSSDDSSRPLAGYQAMVALAAYPPLIAVPIIVLGSGLEESDVPTTHSYDWFFSMPADADMVLGKVAELVGKARTRHKLSSYFCPRCHARLVCVYGPHDLFCLRCGTAVTIEGDACDALSVTGQKIPCSLEHLKPPRRHP